MSSRTEKERLVSPPTQSDLAFPNKSMGAARVQWTEQPAKEASNTVLRFHEPRYLSEIAQGPEKKLLQPLRNLLQQLLIQSPQDFTFSIAL
mmetsp:Transcript_1802/g.2807  ORF Transcript_1802/g.2807 Transcript_1802/m.2807 type:complete len:91 (-) Transcript_1802:124-396(-)